ncbi:MAG TPA: PSD1 and planctomycete cytochrome C domain-containing protein [Pirellulaceae bacterium]|jgi:mono/diheme cytochrome c family protein|nr:PSD1 and planctomycete cytochrome C domain-containing protein [Pirellulaceae bacterium]
MKLARRTAILILSCAVGHLAAAEPIDFVRQARPILEQRCYECHAAEKQKGGLRLDIKSEAFRGGDAYGAAVIPGDVAESPLIQFVADENADLQMPPDGERLSSEEIATLRAWVEQGAIWPDGVDLAKLTDRRDRWSFEPVVRPSVPDVLDGSWPRNDVDRFLLAKLEAKGLRPSPEAERTTWLRRITFDLSGLPPTPERIEAFLADDRPDAFERVVDELLASPRYGERYAQRWLDLVRYADTDGFEVNTPRPNAWPYRDYVIEAFDEDLPYDRFVRDQLCGDATGEDAATGFLVTAAALLPGQIGQDDVSKRLARQDELAETIINASEAFLGLSVGCARCHDHKFDPMSIRDYYSLQAFFAGLQYGERPLRSPEADARKAEAAELRKRVAQIDRELSRFEPLARPALAPQPTDARRNEETFESMKAKFVRFTVHDANLHPTLGLIEPCIDELEIFSSDNPATNLALASRGTKVTASGSRVSSSHSLERIHDGQYGNSSSWMSDEAGRGWVLFELPEPKPVNRVIWSRDREGKLADRLATAYTIEVGLSLDAMRVVAFVPPLRAAVAANRNVDRFAPTAARGVRFTVLETNNLEPCLDELEVFDLAGQNVALGSAGTSVASSGDAPPSDRHKREHVNDGRFGNGRSWISSETGKGWIHLTFEEPRVIDRVVWGRDREGKFVDRLPRKYAIEIVRDDGSRSLVADSSDRRAMDEGGADRWPAAVAGLPEPEAAEAQALLAERTALTKRIAVLEQQPMVFAGKFGTPEATRLLHRGDPEQPKDPVPPATPALFGAAALPVDAPDLARREALADWIVDPQNPLAARVMVNRIWQWHFGVGLVETASDFGNSGSEPTHPELLDWLADEFVRSGWSVKRIHRLIVLSAAYRQSSAIDASAVAVDAESRLLWRFPSRRREAESIRDSMLAVSGRLVLEAGGPGFDLFTSRGGLSGFPPIESFDAKGRRRMVYAHKIRMEKDAVFGAFDCPDAGQTTARRGVSTTPLQALNLFNSRFTVDEASAFADRVASEAGDDPSVQIRACYRLAFGRNPDADEIETALPIVREHGLSTLCRAIFNSNEFLFLP